MRKIAAFLLAISLLIFAGCAVKAAPTPPNDDDKATEEVNTMYLTVNGNKLEVSLAENSSVDALVALLTEGDITYTADDYGGFEKVGSLGHSLPRNDRNITTQAGDVVLYLGNQICIFVDSNSWSYTRLGRINDYTMSELGALLGAGKGEVEITISLK